MLFAVDIDGTIGYRNLVVFLRITNDRLRLGISEEASTVGDTLIVTGLFSTETRRYHIP